MAELSVGNRVGPYQLLSPLGAGGMGEVWKARDSRLDRVVAIKFSHAQFSERFAREARAVAALNHPNIAQVYDVGENYFVMEYVDGEPVRAPADARKLLHIALQIADGLAAAHAAGIVHRDLKPDNVLVTRDGRVKILDFGLAKQFLAPETSDTTRTMAVTNPGTVLGTVAYMSPEQARGEELDWRSDQFSFGLILFELASGKRAFDRASSVETMAAIIRETPPPLPASVPAPLQWTIERCLAKDPADRYDTTRGLFLELRSLAAHLTSPLPASVAVSPRRKTSLVLLTLGCASMAGLVLAGLWFAARRPPAPAAELRYTPFATTGCNERMPAWSPDGQSMAYICNVDGVGQVFTRTLDAISAAQITNLSGRVTSPFWSMDASRIYFTQDNDLYFTGATGGAPQMLIKDATLASLSPDGRRLAFLRQSDHALWLAAADGSGAARYAAPGFPKELRVAFAKFSPDGSKLAVLVIATAQEVTNLGLWIVPLSGGAPGKVTVPGLQGRSFSWLPDGHHILAAIRIPPALEAHLVRVDVTNGDIRPLTSGPLPEGYPAVSPDGKRIATTIESEVSEVMEFSLDSGKGRSVTSSSRQNIGATWAPSGREFAWVCTIGGKARVLFQGDAGSVRALALSGPDPGIRHIEFSPDGQRLALDCYQPKHRAMLVPTNGGVPIELGASDADSHGATFSPDGAWIAYTRYANGAGQLTKVPSSGGGSPIDLAPIGITPGVTVHWSPAGDWIASGNAPNDLRITSPDGKVQRVLLNAGYRGWCFNTKGDQIYGLRRDDKRRWAVWSVEVATGTERKVVTLDVPSRSDMFDLSFHPDGKRFLASVDTVASDIWTIDGMESK